MDRKSGLPADKAASAENGRSAFTAAASSVDWTVNRNSRADAVSAICTRIAVGLGFPIKVALPTTRSFAWL